MSVRKKSKKVAVRLLGRRRIDAIYDRVWNRFGAKVRHRNTHDTGMTPKTSEMADASAADTMVLCDFGCVGASSIHVQTDTNMPVLRVDKLTEESVSGLPETANGVPLGKSSKIIVFLCDPILRNLRFFAWRSRRLGLDRDGLETATFCSSIPPKSFQYWIGSQAINALGIDPGKVERIQNGLAFAPSKFGEVYFVATDTLGDATRKALSDRIGLSVSLLDQAGLDEIDTDDTFLKLAGAGLPKDYVRQALHGPLIRKFYDEEHIREIRLRWEASIEVTRIKRNVPRDRFGNEVSFDHPAPDLPELRTMELEGTFMHKEGRPNIAISKYWSIEASHPEDFYNSQDWQRLNDQNFENWKSGDNDRLKEFLFKPNCNVAIHEIAVQVRDLQIDNYPFLLGDGCLYFSGNGRARKGKMLPGPSEAHCAAVSLRESSSFYRTVDFPDDLPLFLSEQEIMSIPQHFARHHPHEIKQDDMDSTRVRVRISYRPAAEDQKLHKFIRVPYLDQYPAAPRLLPEGRPWYKAWDEQEPLVIRGFSVYFSPRPPTLQVLKDVKIFAVDAEGTPVPGKEVRLMDQTCGGNSESLSLDPGFVRGDLIVEHGEMLSASATLLDGTPTADLAFYILVEIPKSRMDEAFGSPLYYSQGSVNLDYLQSDYPKDRIDYVSTPAAFSVLKYVATSTVSPWDKKFGLANLPAGSGDLQDVYNEASKHIFVD